MYHMIYDKEERNRVKRAMFTVSLAQSSLTKSLRTRMRTVPSSDPDDNVTPSGENATCVTLSLCSLNVFMLVPSFRRQSRTVLSDDADATYRPSGENDAAFTILSWPSSATTRSPLNELQIFNVESLEPERISFPSPENATTQTGP